MLPGLSLSDLKKYKSLIPLFVCLGVGSCVAVGYLARLALFSPDVTWRHQSNPEPWNAYKNKQYKFYSPNKIDYSKIDTKAPNYLED